MRNKLIQHFSYSDDMEVEIESVGKEVKEPKSQVANIEISLPNQ